MAHKVIDYIQSKDASFAPIFKRQNIAKLFHGKDTVLLPSDDMIQELKQYAKEKNSTKFVKKLLSLAVRGHLNTPRQLATGAVVDDHFIIPASASGKYVKFADGVTAHYIGMKNGVNTWQYEGAKIPDFKKVEAKEHKSGAFENPDSKYDEKDLKLAEVIRKDLREKNGVYTVICDLYHAASDKDKELIELLCCADCYKWAILIVLLDNNFIKIDEDYYRANTVGHEKSQQCFRDIVSKHNALMASEEDIDKITKHLKDSYFHDNKYVEFYTEIVESNGRVTIDEKEYQICPEVLAPHIYMLEIFYAFAEKLNDKLDAHCADEDQTEFNKYLEELTVINHVTNTKKQEDVISTIKQYDNDPIESLEFHKKRFEKCGFCIFRRETIKTAGGPSKKVKSHSRKYIKLKNQMSKLSPEDKKKLMSYMSS